jgi:hypothetical protein
MAKFCLAELVCATPTSKVGVGPSIWSGQMQVSRLKRNLSRPSQRCARNLCCSSNCRCVYVKAGLHVISSVSAVLQFCDSVAEGPSKSLYWGCQSSNHLFFRYCRLVLGIEACFWSSDMFSGHLVSPSFPFFEYFSLWRVSWSSHLG